MCIGHPTKRAFAHADMLGRRPGNVLAFNFLSDREIFRGFESAGFSLLEV